MPTPINAGLMTVDEVAVRLGLRRPAVHRLARKGALPCFVTPKERAFLFSRDVVEAYAHARDEREASR